MSPHLPDHQSLHVHCRIQPAHGATVLRGYDRLTHVIYSCFSQILDLEEFVQNNRHVIRHKLWAENRKSYVFVVGVGSFLLYSVHEGIRGIPLDPSDKSDALVPVSGTSLAVGIDFHAGKSFYNISLIQDLEE